MPSFSKYAFQKLNFTGLKTLVGWAKQEGWNPGLQDAEIFWHTDPNGYYGFLDEGKLIAGGSIVSYGGEFGFMGLFIVSPEYRGKGIGRDLWYLRRDMLLQRLKPGAAIGMDGVVSMQPFYKKGGFEISFKDERNENKGVPYKVDRHISPILEEDIEEVMTYDHQCFGFHRPVFMERWIMQPDSHTFKYTAAGHLKGLAVLRKVVSGYKIGPLFADDPMVAETLYCACLNAVPGQQVYLDIPMINENAIALVKKYNARYVFECARMYCGVPPLVNTDRVYGITTFELG